MADSRTAAVHAQDSGERIAKNRKQRVEHQRDDGGPFADAADEGNRDQEAEQRETGDGLHHVGEAEQRRAQGCAARQQDAQRQPGADGDGHGTQHQDEMLAGQLRHLLQQVGRDHSVAKKARASGPLDFANSAGVVRTSSLP